jgi:hypothetical protein
MIRLTARRGTGMRVGKGALIAKSLAQQIPVTVQQRTDLRQTPALILLVPGLADINYFALAAAPRLSWALTRAMPALTLSLISARSNSATARR